MDPTMRWTRRMPAASRRADSHDALPICSAPLSPDDESARLDAAGILRVQRIVGSILYYARALDSPLLPALTEIGSNQAKATEEWEA